MIPIFQSRSTCHFSTNFQKKALKHPNDLPDYLKQIGVPFPYDWRRVSILEAGQNWESTWATKYHNFLGFNACYFTSKEDCANYLHKWIKKAPPLPGESFENYLIRRKYNPNMKNYLKLLRGI